jgi:hypothetical protein
VNRLPFGDGKPRIREPGGSTDDHKTEQRQEHKAQPNANGPAIAILPAYLTQYLLFGAQVRDRHGCSLLPVVDLPERLMQNKPRTFAACRRGNRNTSLKDI